MESREDVFDPDRLDMRHPRAVDETLEVVDGLPPTVGKGMPIGLRHFGHYELLEEVARGGMGVIYRARDNKLDRTVAVMMILDRNLASEKDIARFRVEAKALAIFIITMIQNVIIWSLRRGVKSTRTSL